MKNKSRENFINTLQRELLTSSQAAELLEVTKQRFSVIAKNKNLEPVHQSTQGKLYLRRDIEEIKDGFNKLRRKKEPVFFEESGSTQRAILEFEKNKHLLDEISHIFVYFDRLDAILDGFYIVLENTLSNKQTIDAPNFVLRDRTGKEMWFSNLNCGYGGEGPSGSSTVIQSLGIDPELAEIVRQSHDTVKYFRDENGEFEVYCNNSEIDRVPDYGIQCRYWKGKLIFLQEKEDYLRFDNDLKSFLMEYSVLVPNISDVVIFNSKDEARERGYYINNYSGNEVVYQVIIRDESNRELWLCPEASNSMQPLKYRNNVQELLSLCGFHIEQPIETFPQSVKRWLGIVPHIKSSEILKVEERL
ncbi:hypothetical protein [Bacillus cereus group sp. N21]|uniref:hypothetical protein n=1 Tax=Bacillus cereus group sp. N21 TaxID=2794591 RepID=UPI0018F5F6A1|nr:hypothetical protein [Bacillus cereus group sp. N21]MBJ8031922.1 hypothetical protein [Bacillus cereus group sp. N21]